MIYEEGFVTNSETQISFVDCAVLLFSIATQERGMYMEKQKANQELRERITKAGLHFWEVAEKAGITDCTFSKWLRVELNPERRERIENAILRLTGRR